MTYTVPVLTCLALLVAMPATSSAQDLDRPLSFEDCLEIAMANNQTRTVSRLDVHIAEALNGQATSTFWPQLSLTSALTRMDEDPVFVFPEETAPYTIEDFLPQPVEVLVTVPRQEVKALDRTDFRSMLNLTLPLYTGGKRRGLRQQASAGVSAAEKQARKTDLQLEYDVRRYYYGGVLAKRLVQTAEDALARLEVTLDLTENLYKRGSGSVTKADYLRHKMIVESLRSMLVALQEKEDLAKTALANTMGLTWSAALSIGETQVPFEHRPIDVRDLVDAAYRSSPDWARIDAGLKAAEGKLKEARSEGRPKLALQGQYQYIANSYDAGAVSDAEKRSWRVGLGLQMPLFSGGRHRNESREALARMDKLTAQKSLLKEGLAVQVKALHRTIQRTQAQEKAARAALEVATDNRELNIRAYQDQLVEVEDVISAQVMESFAIAQYEKVRYDQLEAVARLEKVMGMSLGDARSGD